MSSCIGKESAIGSLCRMKGTNVHELIRSPLNIYKQPRNLKKSESNKNMEIKKNKKLYILSQRIFPLRGYL